jgi:hypothetical protein
LQLVSIDIFKEFDKLLQDSVLSQKETKNWKISKETVVCLAQILDLRIVDRNLLTSLGEALLHLSQKSADSWVLVNE